MKYNELNKDISSEYVNTFRIYPNESEIIIDFAQIDYAATRLKAESDGRERPEEVFMTTKARLALQPNLIAQFYRTLGQMMPKKGENNDSEENIRTDSSN